MSSYLKGLMLCFTAVARLTLDQHCKKNPLHLVLSCEHAMKSDSSCGRKAMVCVTFPMFGVSMIFLIPLFSKEAFNYSKVTVKTLTLYNKSISNKCCSFQISIKILKKKSIKNCLLPCYSKPRCYI